MSKLNPGDTIPEFTLPNQDGEEVTISPKDGKARVIYFYPKNETKVCTEEACSFRDWYDDFIEAGYEVVGISSDSIQSHQAFKSRHHLNFNLLSDKKGKVRKLFGASTLFNLLPQRSTFLINQKGKVEHRYDDLFKSQEHVSEMFSKIKELSTK